LLRGLSRACRAADCALLGGETAQMPGMYRRGEYDLAGCIVGVVDRTKIIDGSKIKPGDVVLGLASNGLHTNGYSLARKILFEKMRLKPNSPLPGSTIAVGEELLRVHKNYQPLLAFASNSTVEL
jgi:phosphoribosylformylglycinamidine cyclo-ligase